ncbi:MAG: Ig-like domain-containing protein [Clostridia bacterium]|nr:Ig-like domain-containing protein [Clostridia bacterium]
MASRAADQGAAGAEGMKRIALETGEMPRIDLDQGPVACRFEAPSGSVYDICLFPEEEAAGDGAVRVELWRGSGRIAEGTGSLPALSVRLAAGAEYELRMEGGGRWRLEVARHALSRCFSLPKLLDSRGDTYSKAFARPGDAHWYALEAAGGEPVALVAVPAQEGIRVSGTLFDDAGRPLAEASTTDGGACIMDFSPEPGRRYCVRLTASAGATGLYRLRLSRPQTSLGHQEIGLSRSTLVLMGRQSRQLRAETASGDPVDVLCWESSNPSVASVDESGTVSGLEPGTAWISAFAVGGKSDRCRVNVRRVAVEGVALLTERMTLSVGDDAAVECEIQPVNASDLRLRYDARPEGVVAVDAQGVLVGLREGTAVVTVRSVDGGRSDEMTVTVSAAPRRLRALLVGEQNYVSSVGSVRRGSVNSVMGLRSMLEGQAVEGAGYQVSVLLDASRDEVLTGIDAAFSQAESRDLSLFYLTCHGYYEAGLTCFQMADGSVLSSAELAERLRAVKGDVAVVIDCCGSGGVIGRASGTGDILKGIDRVYQGLTGPSVITGSRFHVLASAALEQDSYRVSFSSEGGEADMSTVFARALCEAGGWNIDRASSGPLRADLDHDGQVTLYELHTYMARRVMWYLELSGSLSGSSRRFVQSVQVWPEGDGLVLFEKD